MPRVYFHLSAPDQDFPDDIGRDVSDLAAAHSIAVRLMKRVMMFSSFSDCAPDLRRWTVKVTDERRRPVFTVIFPTYFVPRGWKPVLVSGARALLRRLDAINAVDDMSWVRQHRLGVLWRREYELLSNGQRRGADHWAADRNNGPDPPALRTILTPCPPRAASRRLGPLRKLTPASSSEAVSWSNVQRHQAKEVSGVVDISPPVQRWRHWR
jgi:hypothetical protein